MKLGCACWVFTKGRFLPPYEPAVEATGELGFEGIEFILRNAEDLSDYWTPWRIDGLRRRCEQYGLEVSQFVLFQDAVADLANLRADAKAKALEIFEGGVKIAKALGSPIVSFVSQWPVGLKAPVDYVPRYWYTNQPGVGEFSPKLTLQLPEPFDWDAIWEGYVGSVRTCARIAASHGLKPAIEGHTHVIVPHTDSFLRLWEHVQDPGLGYNYDTAWQFLQREYVPWSLYKLKGKLWHVHARDGDGLHCYSLPPGQGIIDWAGVFEALRAIGYEGFVSLEVSNYNDPYRWAGEARRYLAQWL